MEISELVGIGRLGRLESDGFYHIQLSQSYKSILTQLRDCFLIFSSNRVFYVTVVETKTFGKHTYLRFQEDGIAEECKRTANVTLALLQEDINELQDEDDIKNIFGYEVNYLEERIGTVIDAIVSTMQTVFIIELNDGLELMVPNVQHYVKVIDEKTKIIRMQNLEELLELCTSMS